LVMAEQLVLPGMRVLDAVRGSGILSIAAARLGTTSILGIDIDPVAVKAARDNTRLNHLSRRIRVHEGRHEGLLPGHIHAYDLVFANITAKVNAALAPTHAALLAPGGWLIASGILADVAEIVASALKD